MSGDRDDNRDLKIRALAGLTVWIPITIYMPNRDTDGADKAFWVLVVTIVVGGIVIFTDA